MNKLWALKSKKFEDPILQILYNRGIISDDNDSMLKKFLDPDFEKDFFDPELLPDFQLAMSRIKTAIENKEKVGIYADYDADGIPGAALLYRALRKFNLNPLVHIPTRQEGYGFSQNGIDELISAGCTLIISVDLGIRELKNAKYIKKKKVDLIITDHHEPDDTLPEAVAIVNPKRQDSKYPFRELSGAGVVFKMLQGFSKLYPETINEKFLKWNLDLVAISTISDVVPLISENRVIAKYGLMVLQKTKNVGLTELYKISGIDIGKIDVYCVGFQIGPRINAPGRLDRATESFNLLVTDDKAEAVISAQHLQGQNEERQVEMGRILKEAANSIGKQQLEDKIIILKDKNWQKGVIGPVASQLVEKYMRPVIILTEKDGALDGSCRSISCFNIVEALSATSKCLTGYGGHKAAAGLHLESENFAQFRKLMIAYANESISDQDLLPKINIDLELDAKKITIGLIKSLDKLEPFGLGNPRPVFLTSKIKLTSHRLVGRENNHLQLKFNNGLSDLKGVVFNHDLELGNLCGGEFYDIVYQPQVNYWNGKNWIDLRIIDIKKSKL